MNIGDIKYLVKQYINPKAKNVGINIQTRQYIICCHQWDFEVSFTLKIFLRSRATAAKFNPRTF